MVPSRARDLSNPAISPEASCLNITRSALRKAASSSPKQRRFRSRAAGGMEHLDCIPMKQVAGWKKITGAVHANGGGVFSQLWHTGRSSHVDMTNGDMPVAPSVVPSYWVDSTPSVSTPRGWVKPSPHRAPNCRNPGCGRGLSQSRRAHRKPPALTGSNFMPPTAICPMNSCRMAATHAPTPMVGRWRTAAVSCWKSWKQWHQYGAAIASLYESGPAEHGTRCRTATRPHSSIISQNS